MLNKEKLTFNSHKSHNPYFDILEYQLNNDMFITYTVSISTPMVEIMEYYSGENYNVGSNLKSYSRTYKKENIPTKYKEIWDQLKEIYNTEYKGK